MQKSISVTEFQRKFLPFLDDVVRTQIPLVLTRGSRPEVVLMPYEDYRRFRQLRDSEVLTGFDKVWDRLADLNDKVSEEEIASDMKAARRR